MTGRAAVVVVLVMVRGAQGWLERSLDLPVGVLADAATVVLLGVAVLRPTDRLGPAGRWAVALVVVSCLWTLPSVLIDVAFAFTGLRAMVLPVLTGCLVAMVLREEGERSLVRAALVAVLVLNVVLALRQVTVGYNAVEMAALSTNDSTYLVGNQARTLGAMVSNQDFGLVVGLAVVVLLAVGGAAGSRRVRWGAVLLGSVCAMLLVTSLLRGALLAALLAVVVLVTFRPSVVRRVAGPVAAVVTTSVAGSALVGMTPGGVLQERLEATVARVSSLGRLGTDRSFRMRAEDTFPEALAAFVDNPLGAGTGAAGTPSQVFPHLAPLGEQIPDNGFLYVGIQTGVVGLFVMCGLLVSLLRNGGLGRVPAHDTGAWVTRAAVVYLAGLMLTGTYWTLTGPCTLLFVLVGLSAPASGALDPPAGPAPSAPGRTVGRRSTGAAVAG